MKNTFTDPLLKRPPISRNLRALIMRISQVSILILTTAIISVAKPGSGQSIETTEVKLEIQNEPLTKVFSEIEKQTDFLFSWAPGKVQGLGRVSIAQGKYTVKEALELVLNGKGLSYKQEGDYVLVFVGKNDRIGFEDNIQVRSTNLAVLNFEAMVSGTVKDASTQEPLAGVNIIVRGTTKGTTTDVEGKFSIEVSENEVLIFSFIGFKPFELQVGGQSVVDVLMEADVTALSEVVVNAGYWLVKDKEQTGNIARVTAEEINKQPVSNPLHALEGRMAGVYINQDNGLPGGNVNIQIRGRNSLRSDANNPLYIIDGVPFTSTKLSSDYLTSPLSNSVSPLSNLNPSDIASIEVLKDADATAIYGSRGANGVVLITTKRAKPGKTRFDIDFYEGSGKATRIIDILNTPEYLKMRREAFKNDGVEPTAVNARDLMSWDTTRYTDWKKELIGGTANVTNAQATLSGGDVNTQFLFSAGYNRETSVFPGEFVWTRGSGNFQLTHTSTNKRLVAVFSVNYSSVDNDLPFQDFTAQALRLAPITPPVYRDDTGGLDFRWANPYTQLTRTYNSKTANLIGNANLSYEVLDGLQLKASFGYTTMQMKELQTNPISSKSPALANRTGSSTFANANMKTWIIEPYADYKARISGGTLTITAGATFQETERESMSISALGYTNDAFIEDVNSASTKTVTSSGFSLYRYYAIFSRINYDWNGKYLINLTGRRDGSSRFGPEKQFANFGAVGAAWVFSNENFIKDAFAFLSFGKLRASYGVTGSDQIGDYGYLDTYSATAYPYLGIGSLVPTRLTNPDYSWETNTKLEAGIEFGIFHDRVFLSSSWYQNKSSNQLVGYSLSTVTGFPNIQYNLPATVQNTGLELELSADVLANSGLTWRSSFNVTIPRNKLISYPNLEGSADAVRYAIGEPLTVLKAYRALGVDQQTGLYKFEDVDGDGNVTSPKDIQTLKSRGQDYYGGWHNTIRLKGVELDFLFQFVKQIGVNYLPVGGFLNPGFFDAGTSMGNQPRMVMSRWQKPGDISNMEKFSSTFSPSYYTNAFSSDNGYSDASFVRLKNVSLGWYLPAKWLRRVRVQNLKLFVQGQNLLTITKYPGDPENQSVAQLPPLRFLTIGFHLSI